MIEETQAGSMNTPEGENFIRQLTRREKNPVLIADYYDVAQKGKTDNSGMGKVYFGQDKRTLKFVVLKTYQTNKGLFEKEANFALRLKKHPNLVYTYSVIKHEQKYYMVMEHIGPRPHSLEDEVQGNTLQKELDVFSKNGLNPKQALLWAIDFCHGMEHLYSQKDFNGHNDIKPSNLFITQEGELKIGDFGLVNETKGGTRGYIPPWAGEKGEQRDIWSFGIVFFEMLNGLKNPLYATVCGEREAGNDELAWKQFWKYIKESNQYHAILRKCLAKDRKYRYARFSDLRTDLEKEFVKLGGDLYVHSHEVQSLTGYENCQKAVGWNTLAVYQEALMFSDDSLNKILDYNEAYFQRGIANLRLGYIGQAKQDFEKAIECKLAKAEVYFNLAQAKLRLDSYSNVIDDYSNAIRLSPQSADYYTYRAYAYAAEGRWKDAIADYEKYMDLLISQEKELPDIENHIWSDDDPDGMAFVPHEIIEKHLKEAVNKYPQNVYYWELLGDTHFNLGEWPDAKKCWEQAVALCIEKGAPFYPRAEWKQVGISEKQEAEYLEQAIKRWPDNPDYKQLKERLTSKPIKQPTVSRSHYMSLEEQDAARLNEREEAVSKNPTAENYLNRAKSYMAVEQMEKAVKDLEKVISLDANSSFAYQACKTLPRVYEKNGQYVQAIQAMKDYLRKKYNDMLNHTEYVPYYADSCWTTEIYQEDLPQLVHLLFKSGKTEKEIIQTLFSQSPNEGFQMCIWAMLSYDEVDRANAFFEQNKDLYSLETPTEIRQNLKQWLPIIIEKA